MASRTRNSTILAASVSESPSLLLPSLTVAHGQASSSIAATTSDIIALFSSLQLENSISYTIGAHHSMFDPSTTGVLGSDFVTNIPISRSIEQHYTTPFVSCFALTSVSIASQTQLNHTASAFLFFNPGIGLDGSLANFHLFQHHHRFDSTIHRSTCPKLLSVLYCLGSEWHQSISLQKIKVRSLMSVSHEIGATIMFKTTAREMWTNLHDRFNQSNGHRILQLKTSINNYKPNTPCTCGAMQKVQDYYSGDQILQFLTGLNKSYWGIRAQIILLDPLLPLSKVFSVFVQQECQRCLGNIIIVAPAPAPAKPKPNHPSQSKKPHLTTILNQVTWLRSAISSMVFHQDMVTKRRILLPLG
ncbi:hypothetical protein CsatA_025741 [Cannabis sativa]